MIRAASLRDASSLLVLVAMLPVLQAQAQSPSPPPARPELVFQDELDLQANSNFVQGSGARALGMGGAFLARADDATAASWNPAGLSYLRAPEVSFVFLKTHFDGRESFDGSEQFLRGDIENLFEYRQHTRDQRSGSVPDFVAFTWPWEAGDASGAVQASFQRVISFTNSRTIEDSLVGTVTNSATGGRSDREDRTRRTVESTGGYDILSMGAGIRVSRELRIGITVNRWLHGYSQTVQRREQTVPSRQLSELDISGWNAHLGAIFSPSDALNLGVVYKSGLAADVKLSRVRYDEFPATPLQPARNNFNTYSRDDLGLTLPGAFGVGLSWRPRSNLTLSADYTRTNWSKGRIRNFFALPRARPTGPLEFPRPDPLESRNFCGEYPPDYRPIPPNPCPPVLPYPTLDSRSPGQADTQQIRAGVEYVLLRTRLKWPLRAGYFRDGQFFRSLDGSAPAFDGVTLGTGLILGSVLLDVAYVYEWGRYLDQNLEVVTDADSDPPTTRLVRGPGDNHVKFHKVYASLIFRLPRKR